MPFSLNLNRQTLKSLRSLISNLLTRLFKMSKTSADQSLTPPPSADPPFDPTTPSVPISYPIAELADLESRSYFDSFHFPFNRASVPLPEAAVALPQRRRILVCHDMMGGYVDDRWVQGGSNDGAYAIWHWYLMDVFVYFSHNLVTIPPPCWTNAAHTHGVKVLGTFITEWEKGEEICRILLDTKKSAQLYAERLTELALTLGFDGWLINMEVKLQRNQVANLKEFVDHLTQTMHNSVAGSLVIWYDGVTVDGHLDYQDQLTEKNKPFFDLCDGIFVNYTWKKKYPKQSAAVAGRRRFDVYMGIDVFGRNTYGGGKWNTNIALNLLKEDDISAAIFAPGWVYEDLSKAEFQSNQNRWWSLVKQSWGVLQSYPKVLPFYSNFDQGHGLYFSIKGVQVTDASWNNISCQGFQPFLEESPYPDQANMQVFINFEDECYSGGCNITCKGNFGENDFSLTRLFQGALPLDDLAMQLSYSVKSVGSSQMGLILEFTSNSSKPGSILLADNASSHVGELTSRFSEVTFVPANKTKKDATMGSAWIMYEASIYMPGYTLTDIHLFCYMGKLEHDEPNLEKSTLTGNGCLLYLASLGHISIEYRMQNAEFPPAASWSVEFKHISWSYNSNGIRNVSLKITWKLESEHIESFTKYNVFVKQVDDQTNVDLAGAIGGCKGFLGVARVEAFYVSDLEVPVGVAALKFIVQVCISDESCQELDESPALLLAVEG